MRLLICFVSFFMLAMPTLASTSINGRVMHVKDADSIVVNDVEIRLYGIDAPETNQRCKNSKGRSYACGKAATKALTKLLRNKNVACRINGKDKYNRYLGVCRRGVVNVNQYLVAQGWAVAYNKYDQRYIDAESMAKRQRIGLWQGEFVNPEVFRRTSNAARMASTGDANSSANKQGCQIKGNINTKGQRIYHTPWGSKNYHKTRISEKKGERWFCSEADAQAAGWRAPKGG